MGAPSFTEEEKRIVHRILQRVPGKHEGLLIYSVYIFPSLLFAAYGLWKRDFVAVLVAYIALLVVALMYLSYTRGDGHALYSAVRKYEDEVGALQGSTEGET